jgi:hypothetical protein
MIRRRPGHQRPWHDHLPHTDLPAASARIVPPGSGQGKGRTTSTLLPPAAAPAPRSDRPGRHPPPRHRLRRGGPCLESLPAGAPSEAPRLVDTCPDGIHPAMRRAAGSAQRGVTVDQGCVLVNAHVHTMDPSRSRASAVAMAGGRITGTGDGDQLRAASPDARRARPRKAGRSRGARDEPMAGPGGRPPRRGGRPGLDRRRTAALASELGSRTSRREEQP